MITLTGPAIAIVSDPAVAFGILSAGAGLAFLPSFTRGPAPGAPELVRVLPRFEGPSLEIFASLPPRRALVPAVRVFLDMLVEQTRL